MPQSQKDCIKSWQKIMPDYKITRWDEDNFDFEQYAASKFAYQEKKYALVSDVCRYNVLYEYGGIYLDTDVKVFKRFDNFLDADFFSAIELYNEFFIENIAEMLNEDGTPKMNGDIPHLEILTSTLGSIPKNQLIGEIRDYYNQMEANEETARNYRKYINNDRLVARFATKYGFRYVDELQHLDGNMVIYPTGIFGHAFCPNQNFEVSYHYNAASWANRSGKQGFLQLLDKWHLLKIYEKLKKLKYKN